MPYLISAGKVTQNNVPTPMYILARLNLDGQAISVAKEYKDLKVGVDAAPLKAAFAKKKAAGKAVKVAMTFPGGTHDLWIRYWLAAGGIDPDKDVADHRRAAAADGGEHEGRHHGRLLRRRAVERAARQPEHRLHRAHHRRDLEQPSGEGARHARRLGRQESERRQGAADGGDGSAEVVRQAGEQAGGRDDRAAKRQWFNVPVADIIGRVKGEYRLRHTAAWSRSTRSLMKFWRDHASYPFQSHDLWFLTEDIRWGKFAAGTDTKALIAKVNREDIWREAAKDARRAGGRIPASTSRGKETFFDGKVFDPENPAAYLASLAIKRAEV